MKIQHVPLEWVNHTWPQVEGFIRDALEHAKGDYTLDHVQSLVSSGAWTLVVGVEDDIIHGAATVSVSNRPADRVAFITTLGGKLVINDEKAWLYVPEEHMVYVQDAPQILKSKMTIRFLAGMGKLEDAFAVAFTEEPSSGSETYRLTLTPKVYEGGIKTLTATVDTRTFYITAFDFTDMYDNTTKVSLSNVRINTGLPENLFQFTPPPGTDIYHVQ